MRVSPSSWAMTSSPRRSPRCAISIPASSARSPWKPWPSSSKPISKAAGMGGATFLIVGVNHRTGLQLLRERLQGDSGDVLRLLGRRRDNSIDGARAVAPGDRCEVWCVPSDAAATQARLPFLLAEAAGLEPADIVP